MEFYSVIKKNKIMPFAGKLMELENIKLSEINQSQKTESWIISLISGWWYIMRAERVKGIMEEGWIVETEMRDEKGEVEGNVIEWGKYHYMYEYTNDMTVLCVQPEKW